MIDYDFKLTLDDKIFEFGIVAKKIGFAEQKFIDDCNACVQLSLNSGHILAHLLVVDPVLQKNMRNIFDAVFCPKPAPKLKFNRFQSVVLPAIRKKPDLIKRRSSKKTGGKIWTVVTKEVGEQIKPLTNVP